MPLNDIEQDEAPRDDKTRQSLNTTNRTNTKRDNVDDDTADKLGGERTDTDGGHKRDTTSGGAVVSSGNKEVKKDPPPEEKTDDDNAISGFIQKLLSGTFGDTSGDNEEEKKDEGAGKKDTPPDKPKDDEFIDKDTGSGEKNTGSDRGGEFGSGVNEPKEEEKPKEEPKQTVVETPGEVKPPTFNSDGGNRSKGLNIEYKGVKYEIDRKGTVSELDGGGEAWKDDTVKIGETEITLLEYFAKSDAERIDLFNTALGLVDPEQTETPKDENPETNPQDPEQKFEIKEKSNESPEGAPVQVENSKALTEIKKRLLDAKRDGVPASMRVQSFIKPVFGAGEPAIQGGIYVGPTSTGYWGFRSNVNGTANQAGAANQYKRVESSITGAVKFGPGKATWSGITKKAILGVQVHPEKNLKITNYPIIMNAPEVGIPNTAIPYVFENQTEQHRMVTGAIFNESGWGIGAMESYSSWAERSHWCGYHAKFCWNHSGYIPLLTLNNPEGAGNATDVYSKTLPKPVTPESEGTYASLPMFVNPDTGKMEVDPDLYDMGSPIKGAKDAREHCHLYKFYKQTSYTKKTIQKIPGTKKVKGKLIEVMNEKVIKEQIAITVYEQMLPNPISAIFIRGIHFNGQKQSGQITEMGKKLMDHFLSQRGWEASIITRGGHVEVCPYLDPDGTMWRLGGNTGSDAISGNAAAGSAKVSGAGWRFCCQPGKIWNFAGDAPGAHIAFHKLINAASSPEYQKVEPTMNGIFRRTELVDNYMKAVVNRQKGILATLKNTLYDQIIEPG